MGKTRKKKPREKLAGREKGRRRGERFSAASTLPRFLPFYYRVCAFSIQRTISELVPYVTDSYEVLHTKRRKSLIRTSSRTGQDRSIVKCSGLVFTSDGVGVGVLIRSVPLMI